MDLNLIKRRFDIIGNHPMLNRAIEIAKQVASTDLSVLITGESGVGKESIPQIIHQNSPRKHTTYIAVNCGAIPEGTIDSELFGHEKGSFTGANETRKGYFEVADGGTIFLDEVAELPLSTQVKLLRVLQTGEFLKVGSSKTQKSNVRVVAATNINLPHAINIGKFREDLYYRLNTVPIVMPPLRDRKEDIYLLFKKFSLDFADKYKMPAIRLTPNAITLLESYRWPGNIRQLKNIAEQMSVLEQSRSISENILGSYIPTDGPINLPITMNDMGSNRDHLSDRDILYKVLFQLRKDIDELKSKIEHPSDTSIHSSDFSNSDKYQTEEYEDYSEKKTLLPALHLSNPPELNSYINNPDISRSIEATPKIDNLSLYDINAELMKIALEKHRGKRKDAAKELGISERTLYRKIKELKLDS